MKDLSMYTGKKVRDFILEEHLSPENVFLYSESTDEQVPLSGYYQATNMDRIITETPRYYGYNDKYAVSVKYAASK